MASDRPEGVILFDGDCVLCSAWVRFVIERDGARRFCFVTLQTPPGRALAEEFDIDPDTPETNALVLPGRVLFKSDAALGVLERLPGWRWTSALRLLPKPARDWFYDRIARNRYALFGRRERCLVPGPEIADRFLDRGDQAADACRRAQR